MKKLINAIKIESERVRQLNQDELEMAITSLRKQFDLESLSQKGTNGRIFYPEINKIKKQELIIKWFGMVQEVSSRTIGLKHFDTQLLAGLLLHEGNIVEMKTGEGKTLSSTLPISLNALSKKGVHVVTVNDYLAERDKNWMGKLYQRLGLSVGLVKSTDLVSEKRKNYNSDITYVTNSEVVFDYLRDSSALSKNEIVQRPFHYCIVDEIDYILIDEARTPLILSSLKGEVNASKLKIAKALANKLEIEKDFEVDEKRRDINLTEEGYQEAKKLLGKKSLYEVNDPWILEVLNALKAKHLFKLNKDYIILNKKICIVDEFTGRIMEDRRWSLGIHEAIEMKENVEMGGETKTKSSITYQNFFTLYPTLAGMTGTGKTAEKEFQDIYGLEVIVLPTFRPMVRKDLSDMVYKNELTKWKAVLKEAKKCYQLGQPILIGTGSVEKSEFLSDLFKASKIPHQVLNAKPENVFRENEIIAQAGERSAVTIATNMAGRGTDIILGGNPIFKVKQKLLEFFFEEEIEENILTKKFENLIESILEEEEEKIAKKIEGQLEKTIQNLPYSLDTASPTFAFLYAEVYKEIYSVWEKENEFVKAVGGLFVLGTERHETRRIDNQLRGRAGRQGDPGISQFFVCLDDDLIKVFGGDGIKKWVDYLLDDEDTPLESKLLTKSLENAQEKIELYNYDIRKNVFQYDNILNNQRRNLFQGRQKLLTDDFYKELTLRYSELAANLLSAETKDLNKEQENKEQEEEEDFEAKFDSYSSYLKRKKEEYEEIWISNDLRLASGDLYQVGFLKNNTSAITLAILDFYWTEHLERMSYIRETINWRSYGQQNPLLEYNVEAFNSFKAMFEQIRTSMLYYFLDNPIIN